MLGRYRSFFCGEYHRKRRKENGEKKRRKKKSPFKEKIFAPLE